MDINKKENGILSVHYQIHLFYNNMVLINQDEKIIQDVF